ncbi:MAG: tRNA (N6-isopentenyl adenosine(37)-C2)-methylthiotransferase MiaB [Dehalococcoidia bacterium]|nr:tRNA (N6-isopentenyl adenosine(37)-C2)-methylthiotransferase MiaB [Dehalococcoidia bacterium]
MPRYHLWTIGCQMNQAESRRIDGLLAAAGYEAVPHLEQADLVILNTCVVRQSAEDRILGTLGLLAGMKRERPGLNIAVTGCFTARDRGELRRRFPHVDLFFGSGEYAALSSWLGLPVPSEEPASPPFPSCLRRAEAPTEVSAYVPIIQGCNNFCTYCIVPYTRGREVSRTLEDVEAEVTALVSGGISEVSLLGQNVDSYGHDLPGAPSLANLLELLHPISGLRRLRFLTNHPKDMSRRLIGAMASLDKVCEHLDLALQSGDDDMLKSMGRGYTSEQFRALVSDIRAAIPGISIATDIIVGFPGETDDQFERTFSMLREIRFDTVHVAAYSPRPGTAASRLFEDSVSESTKQERFHRIEELQEAIAAEINAAYFNRTVEVLVEGTRRGKWFGRTRTNKLVFFEDERDHHGQTVQVAVSTTSPWALQGNLV